MCGRYLLRAAPEGTTLPPWSEYWQDINLSSPLSGTNAVPRYNICPSQSCLVIRNVEGTPQADILNWGFKPSWSKYAPSINARAEGVAASKMFKGSLRHKRCLVICDGFYEPKGPSGSKNRPWYLFEFEDRKPFAMAGIWTEDGFAIITSAANQQVTAIHDRMPLIIEEKNWRTWMDLKLQDEKELVFLLESRDYPRLVSREVSNFVKKPGNEGEECIKAV